MFARNELTASLSIPLFAVVLAVSISVWAPANQVALWLSAVFITKGIILSLCRRLTHLPRKKVHISTWRNRLIIAEIFYGLAWSSIVLIALTSDDQAVHIFIFASFIAVISIRMTFASTIMPLVIAGTIPMTLSLVTYFLMLQDPFYWSMAAMALGVQAYLIFLMTGLNSTVHAMLEYRAQKDLLIGELEEANAFSDDARIRAEEANLAKSRFLATMSHELRTPLNAILGFSEVMKTEAFGKHANPTYKEYATDIHTSGQHLLNLINEILDLSRIEAERYDLNEEIVHLADIAEDCQRLITMRAQNKDIEMKLFIEEELDNIWVDERAIRQVCLNLLSNAVKFTPQNGTITLTLGKTEDGGQFLSVTDTGPGIPEDEIDTVLKPFGQGSLAHETAEGGTGLGLAICQKLINIHDGAFELKSEIRKGTSVRFEIPAKRVMQALPAVTEPVELHLPHITTLQEEDVQNELYNSITEQIKSLRQMKELKLREQFAEPEPNPNEDAFDSVLPDVIEAVRTKRAKSEHKNKQQTKKTTDEIEKEMIEDFEDINDPDLKSA